MLSRIFDLIKKIWHWLLGGKVESETKTAPVTESATAPPSISTAQILEIMAAEPPAYHARKFLCTQSERTFYEALREAIGYEFLICPKVRLGDILWLDEKKESQHEKLFATQILCKHVDFLLCEKWMLKPVLAIELDDRGHSRFDRSEQDEFKNRAFAIASLPLLRVKVQERYPPKELRAEILAKMETKNEAKIEQ